MEIHAKYSQDFDAEIMQAKEQERLNLARELHDEMGQDLTAIHLYALSILKLSETTAISDKANAIEQILKKISDTIHDKFKQLRLKDFTKIEQNFAEHFYPMIQDWNVKNPEITVDTQMHGVFAEIDSHILFTAYRLIQECLTNISRHAKASNVMITIEKLGQYMSINVVDNGNGFDVDKTVERLGIVGMKERITECDGIFNIVTAKGEGVDVSISLPCIVITEGERQ